MFKGWKHWHKIAILIAVGCVTAFAASFLFSAGYQICQPADYTRAKDCAEHHLGPFVLLWIIVNADTHSGLVTAIATVLLSIITYLLVSLGRDQSRTTRAQLRAYVFVEKAEVIAADGNGAIIEPARQIQPGDRAVSRIQFKNFGQTPAYEMQFFGEITVVGWPLDPSHLRPLDMTVGKSTEILGPSATRMKFDILGDGGVLNDGAMGALHAGWFAIFVYGEVHYRDVFGRKWITEYRSFAGGPTGLRGTTLSAHDAGNHERHG